VAAGNDGPLGLGWDCDWDFMLIGTFFTGTGNSKVFDSMPSSSLVSGLNVLLDRVTRRFGYTASTGIEASAASSM
jgi:hypothetical protein